MPFVARSSHPSSMQRATDSFEQYLSDIRDLPMIDSAEEEREIARRAREGCPLATERLVTANLRFVISYVKRYQGHGLELADLVAIGNEGLLRAVEKFDPDRGVKFISYAVWWIRQAVLKALAEQTRTVRYPLNQNTALTRLAKVHTLLIQELGRQPTDEEVAKALGVEVQYVVQARRLYRIEVSLDAPVDVGDERSSTLGERMITPSELDESDIESQVDRTLRAEFLNTLLRKYLTHREARILSMYYGLPPETEPLTLEEIGAALGVTRERIRQLRERAFIKLKASPEVRNLTGGASF